MSIEMDARVAAAAAVLADFRTTTLDLPGVPDWHLWSLRLAQVLADVLEQIDADPDGRKLAQVRAIFDTFCWETDDRQYALEQIEDTVMGDGE